MGRLRSVLLPALLVCALPAAEAGASLHLIGAQGGPLRGPFASWARAARVPLPDGKVTVSQRGCPGRPDLAGCVRTSSPRTIYLRRGAKHLTFLHELGHVFDLTTMSAADRRAFMRVHWGRVGSWWAGRTPPGEWFAEAYSLCARFGLRRHARFSSSYGYGPSARHHRASCRVIQRAGERAQLRLRKRPQPEAPPTLTEGEKDPSIQNEQPKRGPPPAPAEPAPRRCLLDLCY